MIMSPEANFLSSFFLALNTAHVHYAVMRNHQPLPYSAGGSDLDILVQAGDLAPAKGVLLSVVDQVDGHLIGIAQTWNFFQAYIIGKAGSTWWGVCVEFYTELAYKSTVPLIDYVAISKHLDYHNSITVIPALIGNTIGFIKEILAHDIFRKDKPQYRESATSMVHQHPTLFHEVFSPLGHRGHALLKQVLINSDPIQSKAKIRQFRWAMVSQALMRHPMLFVYKRLGHEVYRLNRFINPPGSVIAILGVDGAGKSTIINAILPALNAATHNAVFVQHLRPNLLPPLARLKGPQTVPVGPVVEPHGSTPSGIVGSCFRLTYLSLDYILGYWLLIRRKIAFRPAIVLFDRYVYDMTIDPRRFRIGVPGWVARGFTRWVPKPDLILCLVGKPEVLAARKGELPVAETRRQVEALQAFAANERRAVVISTETTIEETRDRVLEAICHYLRAKADRRR